MHSFRNTRTAAVCVLIVLLTVFAATLGGTNAVTYNGETVYFTVVNDTMLDLSYSSMPVLYDGRIYVPYTLFVSYFDVKSVYSASDQVLFLSNSTDLVKFDLTAGIAYDRNQNEIRQAAHIFHGQVYVPAEFTAGYFNLSYALLPDSYIVRIYDGRATYLDAFLAGQFASRMEEMLASLATTQSEASTRTTAASSAASESAPATSAVPTGTALPTGTTATLAPSGTVRLCFDARDADMTQLQEILGWLSRAGITACFLTDGEDAQVLAAVAAYDQTLALTARDSREAGEINERIERVLRVRAVYFLASEADDPQELTDAGLFALEPAAGLDADTLARFSSVLSENGPQLLLISDCGQDTTILLDSLQASARRSGAVLRSCSRVYGG